MANTTKDPGAPVIISNLLRLMNTGLVLSILGLFVAELGVLPTDAAFSVLQPAYLLFYWSGIVLLMVWSWQATKYLKDVSAYDLTNGPAMAGFSLIIPVLNLWKPYQCVRDIYKSSRNPDGWPNDRRASIIGWWWGFYIAGNMGGITLRFIPQEAFSGGMTNAQYAHLAMVRLLILTGYILLLIIISRVEGWLKRKPAPAVAEVF